MKPLSRKVLDLIEDNFSDSTFGVEDLADKTGISRAYLTRTIKKDLGVSPGFLIREKRLTTAAEILRTTKIKPASVSLRTGFSSHSYFSDAFRRRFGISPSDYTNQQQT